MRDEKVIKEHYHHVDNGGVTFSVIDKGIKHGGLVLRMETQYYGYPSLMSELRIENELGAEFLEKIGLMLIAASSSIKEIDFSKRYE